MCPHLLPRHHYQWLSDFNFRCCGKLEGLGDGATNAKQYDKAISQYTAALSLDPPSPHDLLVKRSKAHAEKGNWNDALNDANEVACFGLFVFVYSNEYRPDNQT